MGRTCERCGRNQTHSRRLRCRTCNRLVCRRCSTSHGGSHECHDCREEREESDRTSGSTRGLERFRGTTGWRSTSMERAGSTSGPGRRTMGPGFTSSATGCTRAPTVGSTGRSSSAPLSTLTVSSCPTTRSTTTPPGEVQSFWAREKMAVPMARSDFASCPT